MLKLKIRVLRFIIWNFVELSIFTYIFTHVIAIAIVLLTSYHDVNLEDTCFV